MPSPVNFLIVHGTQGNPEGNWFPWLKAELEKNGHAVFVPQFPTPQGQSFDVWKSVAVQTLKDCDPGNTILIGHSIGAIFVLRLAEVSDRPFKAVFSICPFARDLGLKDFDSLNSTFIHHVFDWNRIRRNAEKIVCYAGDNDPYVPLAYSKEVADHAASEFTVVKNGKHLNAESGYTQFPLLLDKIRQGLS